MANGRKLTNSRNERLLGSYSSYSHAHDLLELGEDDVWSMVNTVDEREGPEIENSHVEWCPRASAETNGSVASRRSRQVAREDSNVSGLSLAFDHSGKTASSPRILHQLHEHNSVLSPCVHHTATSAPLKVPDWSKILRVDSVDSLYELSAELDGNDSVMIPPHEYLAREHTRDATSVFEGVGRTLKGRDMRRVRDAVWSRTGYDG